MVFAARAGFGLQERFFAVAKALGTKPMVWFAALHIRLRRISERTDIHLFQCVALLLCVPCLKLSHACFKFAYFFGQRHLALVGRKSTLLGGHDLSLQFDNCIPKFGSVSETHQFLRGLSRRFERVSAVLGSKCTKRFGVLAGDENVGR